jgi:hypothetical protein
MRLKGKEGRGHYIGTLFLPLISYGLKIGMCNALPFGATRHQIPLIFNI